MFNSLTVYCEIWYPDAPNDGRVASTVLTKRPMPKMSEARMVQSSHHSSDDLSRVIKRRPTHVIAQESKTPVEMEMPRNAVLGLSG